LSDSKLNATESPKLFATEKKHFVETPKALSLAFRCAHANRSAALTFDIRDCRSSSSDAVTTYFMGLMGSRFFGHERNPHEFCIGQKSVQNANMICR
jgi:hypothetical protein